MKQNCPTLKFVDLMLDYVVENNFDKLDLMNETLPNKYAVLIALSFSVVIRTEYTDLPVENEICRVKIDENTTKETLKADLLNALDCSKTCCK